MPSEVGVNLVDAVAGAGWGVVWRVDLDLASVAGWVDGDPDVAEGRSNQGIAAALHITQRTVETHISEVFAKLGLDADPTTNRRVHAALAWPGGAEPATRTSRQDPKMTERP